MRIKNYSDKSFVLIEPLSEQLGGLNGCFNSRLNKSIVESGCGWIFSKKYLKDVKNWAKTQGTLVEDLELDYDTTSSTSSDKKKVGKKRTREEVDEDDEEKAMKKEIAELEKIKRKKELAEKLKKLKEDDKSE